MTILMWISRWQNEMELMIMGLQIILFLFLTIGVFCIVRQQKQKAKKNLPTANWRFCALSSE